VSEITDIDKINCERKITYSSRSRARKTAKNMNHSVKRSGGRVGAYKCPVCGLFHVGHKASRAIELERA